MKKSSARNSQKAFEFQTTPISMIYISLDLSIHVLFAYTFEKNIFVFVKAVSRYIHRVRDTFLNNKISAINEVHDSMNDDGRTRDK